MSEPWAWPLFEVRETGQTGGKSGFQRLCVFQEGQGVNEGVERDKLPVKKHESPRHILSSVGTIVTSTVLCI